MRSRGFGTDGPLMGALTCRPAVLEAEVRDHGVPEAALPPRRQERVFLHVRPSAGPDSDPGLPLHVPNPAVLITWLVPLRLHIPSPLRSSVSVSQSPLPTGTPGLLCDRISAALPDDFISTPLHVIKSAKTQLPHRVTSTGVCGGHVGSPIYLTGG